MQIHGTVYLFESLRNPGILYYNQTYFQMQEKSLPNLTPHVFKKTIFMNDLS